MCQTLACSMSKNSTWNLALLDYHSFHTRTFNHHFQQILPIEFVTSPLDGVIRSSVKHFVDFFLTQFLEFWMFGKREQCPGYRTRCSVMSCKRRHAIWKMWQIGVNHLCEMVRCQSLHFPSFSTVVDKYIPFLFQLQTTARQVALEACSHISDNIYNFKYTNAFDMFNDLFNKYSLRKLEVTSEHKEFKSENNLWLEQALTCVFECSFESYYLRIGKYQLHPGFLDRLNLSHPRLLQWGGYLGNPYNGPFANFLFQIRPWDLKQCCIN